MTEERQNATETPEGGTRILTATIAPGYWIRAVLIALMCLVLGLWGVYDYVIAIPNAERMSERREVTQEVKNALESTGDAKTAAAARSAALQTIDGRHGHTRLVIGHAQDECGPARWRYGMAGHASGMEELSSGHNRFERNTDARNATSRIGRRRSHGTLWRSPATGGLRPSDPVDVHRITPLRTVLPLGLIKYGPRTYELDADGSVHTPEGVFSHEQIEDIDMNRWMAKSTAELVLVDGRRVKLDAYIYKNLHLIIGSVAHRLHPDAWTEDARQVKKDKSTESASDEDA